MNKISIILLTKNEQENLKKWSNWLTKQTKINEIIAVDDNSTDETKKVLKSLESHTIKVQIFSRGLNGNFADQRNFAVNLTTNNWILFIDADEIPSPKLIHQLNNIDLDDGYCYRLKRYLVYGNHVLYHGVSSTDCPIRLFHKDSGKFVGPVHEVWQTDRKIRVINEPLFHYSAPTLKIFLNKLNNYSSIRAQELFESQTKVNLFDIFFYPKAKFIQYYFWHLGIIDGVPGLIICLSLSFYSFLVRSKLWHLYHS